jgi:CheY-like chemotaxis protein
MSHEIRTPLHAVIGMADLIEQTELSDEQREYVSTIHSSGESLLTLLSDILDFSKLEAGKVDVEEMMFDLRRCIDEAIDVVAPAAAKKGLELLCELSERAPSRIRSDPTRLRQILLNLLSNAVKFTAKGDIVVRVDARPHAGGSPDDVELEIAVRDDGFGIPKEKLGRLFQSFSQVDASTTRQFGGTGLGLAICQALAMMLGGRIAVVSEPGKGSTFTLTIRTKVVLASKAEEDAASLAAVRGARAALFGTHAGVRTQVTQWLGRWGVEVVDEDFGVAILDVGATAEATTAVARLRGVGVETSIVALVPLGEPHVVGELGRVGVIPVTKPAKPPRILRALARALSGGQSLAPTGAGSSAVIRAVAPRALRVLVAEDNEVNQVVEKRMLEQLGHTVDIAENGVQAIAAMRARSYDVVLLDMQMPELDGLATATQIVEEWPRARPRLVALTANAMSGDRERCLAAGMDDYLAKPIRRQALEAALRGAPASDPVGGASPIPTTQSGLLDREVIDDLRALDALSGKSVLKEMVEVFLRDGPAMIGAVEAAVAASDVPGAGRAAHKLKGSAAALGVYRVAFVASGIEEAAASGDLDATTQGARALTAALEAVEPALRHLAAASPATTPGRAQEGQ